jgi:hypothetical protein
MNKRLEILLLHVTNNLMLPTLQLKYYRTEAAGELYSMTNINTYNKTT